MQCSMYLQYVGILRLCTYCHVVGVCSGRLILDAVLHVVEMDSVYHSKSMYICVLYTWKYLFDYVCIYAGK